MIYRKGINFLIITDVTQQILTRLDLRAKQTLYAISLLGVLSDYLFTVKFAKRILERG